MNILLYHIILDPGKARDWKSRGRSALLGSNPSLGVY